MIHCVFGAVRVSAEPHHARAEMSSVIELPRCVFGTELGRMRAFAELRGPGRVANQQAPVVGAADGVEQIKMRARVSIPVNVTATVVRAGDHRGDAHIKEGIRLALRVHAGKAVDETGDQVLPCAVDDARVGRNREVGTSAHSDDLPLIDNHDGVVQIPRRTAPIGHIHKGATREHELRSRGGNGIGRRRLRPG